MTLSYNSYVFEIYVNIVKEISQYFTSVLNMWLKKKRNEFRMILFFILLTSSDTNF